MKTLNLIVTQKWFDKIVSGEKKQEFRELRPRSEKRYIQYDENGMFEPIPFEYIRFYAGYKKDRNTALVEVKDISFIDYVDENGEIIVLNDNGVEYDKMSIVYDLGDVIEVDGVKK